MTRRKIGLAIFATGTLASFLVLMDFIIKGVTTKQGVIGTLVWVSAVSLFFLGFEVMTRRK